MNPVLTLIISKYWFNLQNFKQVFMQMDSLLYVNYRFDLLVW